MPRTTFYQQQQFSLYTISPKPNRNNSTNRGFITGLSQSPKNHGNTLTTISKLVLMQLEHQMFSSTTHKKWVSQAKIKCQKDRHVRNQIMRSGKFILRK